MKKTTTLLLSLCFSVILTAQKPEPPIATEILFGNERVNLALSLNKPIAGKFRYNNISSASSYYDYIFPTNLPTFTRNELVSVNSFIYQFHKNVGVSGGVQWHFVKGLVPIAAVHFSYADPVWLLVFTPYADFMPYMAAETVGIVEFKPKLTNDLKLFTRAQGFYAYDFKKSERERAMAYFRLGLTMKKYTFGFGANLDYYRPVVSMKQNYGGFFRVDI